MNDLYNQLAVSSGITDGTKTKPEVYYEGEPHFWYWHHTDQEVASLTRVLNHPRLGNCINVRTSTVLQKFEGGFETRNTIYKKATQEIRAMYKPTVGMVF